MLFLIKNFIFVNFLLGKLNNNFQAWFSYVLIFVHKGCFLLEQMSRLTTNYDATLLEKTLSRLEDISDNLVKL